MLRTKNTTTTSPPGRPAGRLLTWLPLVTYLALIMVVGNLLRNPGLQPPGSDKLWHALEYGLLAAFTLSALRRTFRRARLWELAGLTFLFCLGVGAADELLQSYVPGRQSEWADVAFDSLGALLYLLPTQALHQLRQRGKAESHQAAD